MTGITTAGYSEPFLQRNAEHILARMTLTAYLSKLLGQKPEDIKIYVHESLLGGGFGGKQDYDEILAAAYCAKEVGRPVKLIQTRESTFATSFARRTTRLLARHARQRGGRSWDRP